MEKAPRSLRRPMAVFSFHYRKGEFIPSHNHPYHQLIYAVTGCMRVVTGNQSWIIPPQRGVWVPRETLHAVTILSDSSMKTLYMETNHHCMPACQQSCCVISISPLARELLNRASDYQDSYSINSPEERLLTVLCDQFSLLAVEPLTLPKPTERRLKKVTQALYRNPGNNRTLPEWGEIVGASSRTLTRLFLKETAMNFQQWRTQLRLLKSIELLAEGVPVQKISDQLGYSHSGAFIHMFHQALGVTPTHYFKKSV